MQHTVDDPVKNATGKHGCRCFGCNRLFYRYPDDQFASFICSKECYVLLKNGEFSHVCVGHYPNLDYFKEQIRRALKRCDKLKCFFAFKTPEQGLNNLGDAENVNDINDLIED